MKEQEQTSMGKSKQKTKKMISDFHNDRLHQRMVPEKAKSESDGRAHTTKDQLRRQPWERYVV